MTAYLCQLDASVGLVRRHAYEMTFHVIQRRTKGPRCPILSLQQSASNFPHHRIRVTYEE